MELEKPPISLDGQDELDLFYMYWGADGEGEPLYGTTLMASGPAAFKHKPSAGDDSVSVLVDSGASGYYFDDSGLPPFLWGELMMAASYICNWILYSALNIETPYKKLYRKDADLSHLKIIGARAFLHIKNPNKLGHTSWERMVCSFSETESNSYRIWNPKTRRVVESRNVVFIETPPNLLPAARPLSPQQDIESSSYDFSDNYVSDDDILRDVQNYTSVLDFSIDTSAGTVKLLLPNNPHPA